jgi:hypothetical protein
MGVVAVISWLGWRRLLEGRPAAVKCPGRARLLPSSDDDLVVDWPVDEANGGLEKATKAADNRDPGGARR